MFRAVSLGVPSSRSPGANARMGGAAPSTLKKLNGAALTLPSGLRVVTSAIGRGVTRLARIGYARSANWPSKSSSIPGRMPLFGQESQRAQTAERGRPLRQETTHDLDVDCPTIK